VFELPEVALVAEERLRTSGYSTRIDVLAGELLTGDVPRGYSAFRMANLVHYFLPEANRAILRTIRAAAERGARLLIADFLTDPTNTQPLPAALMAGEVAVHVTEGDVQRRGKRRVAKWHTWAPRRLVTDCISADLGRAVYDHSVG